MQAGKWDRGGVEVVDAVRESQGVARWNIVVSAGLEAPALTPDPSPSLRAERGEVDQTAIVPAGLDIEAVLRLFEEWMRLDVGDGKASPATLAAYRGDVKQHLFWLVDRGLTPAQVNTFVLKDYRAHLVETYQVSTAGRKLASIRRFYEMAQAHGLLPTNPGYRLKSPTDKTETSEKIKYLTLAGLKALLDATATAARPEQQIRDRAMIVLMALHGLRVVEVSRLDVGDVDLEAGEAGEATVLGKGDKRRKVLLTEETRLELEKWLAVRRLLKTDATALFVSLHWGGAPDELHQRLSRRGIREVVDGHLVKAKMKRPGVSCHALRHTYATQSLAAGANLLAISGSMGHSSVTTTQVYAKIVDRARHNPAKFLVGVL